MGRNISHGGNQNGEERLSYLSIDQMGKELSRVLQGGDWAKIRHLFEGSADIMCIPPRTAAMYASVLHTGASHRRMPGDWGQAVTRFANAGDKAARAGETWVWS